MRIKENHIKIVDKFKLLGVTLDRELNLDQHVSNVSKKVNQRYATTSRNACYFQNFKEKKKH